MKSVWKGTMGIFGVVNIPVKLGKVVSEQEGFTRICPYCGGSVGNLYACKDCNKSFAFGEWNTGTNLGNGEFLTLDKDEIEALRPERSDIQLLQFVTEINPLTLTGDHYYILVEERKTKKPPTTQSMSGTAYAALREVLRRYNLSAIGKYADRGKETFICVRVHGDGLLLTKMYYYEYIREDEFGEYAGLKVGEAEVSIVKELITKLPVFDYTTAPDAFRARVDELIQKTLEIGHKPPITPSFNEEEVKPMESGGSFADMMRKIMEERGIAIPNES